MECRGYGPCEIPGVTEAAKVADAVYDDAACRQVGHADVLERLCGRMRVDEPLYHAARRRFEARVESAGGALRAQLARLRAAGTELERRATAQAAAPRAELERRSGSRLQRQYRSASGGGVPWTVDETSGNYLAHERARYSCVNCSGDVVPEKDLVGCWPLWPQFAPDELRYRCTRTWSVDPGLDQPQAYRSQPQPLPCWQTCWAPTSEDASDAAHCTPPCPTAGVPSASAWRREWLRERAAFEAVPGEGSGWAKTMAFVTPKNPDDFIWNVY